MAFKQEFMGEVNHRRGGVSRWVPDRFVDPHTLEKVLLLPICDKNIVEYHIDATK